MKNPNLQRSHLRYEFKPLTQILSFPSCDHLCFFVVTKIVVAVYVNFLLKAFKLTHLLLLKIVMERVAKRFLLHSNQQREDVKESDFDELKQDIRVARNEINSDVISFGYNLVNYTAMLHKGINTLCEHFFQNDTSPEIAGRYKLFQAENFRDSESADEVSLSACGEGSTNKSSSKSICGSIK